MAQHLLMRTPVIRADVIGAREAAAPPRTLERGAAVATGIALAAIVVWDGSPLWRLTRLVTVAALGLLVHRLLARPAPVRAGAVGFLSGCVALSIGVGIGLPHAAKAGWHPLTVAGLVALAGGLVLLGTGGLRLVRAAGSWRGLVALPALLVVVALSVWTLGQAVAATNVPRTDVESTTPGDLGLDYRDVTFPTTDGVTLSGWYVPSTNRAAVVLLHGAGSTRSGVLDHAVALAREGFGVLLFDARGHGRSDGRAMDFGWYGDEDTMAAVSFLASQPDVDESRIAAVGMSMGGEQAIGAAAADPRIAAVVAEGATNRVAADKDWLSDVHGWRGAVQERVEWLVYAATDLLTDAAPPIALRDAVAAAARPVLLIAGGEMPDEADAGRAIRAAAPDSVELWVVPGTGHTDALATHPQEWEQRVTEFLAQHLGVAPR